MYINLTICKGRCTEVVWGRREIYIDREGEGERDRERERYKLRNETKDEEEKEEKI